MKRPGDLGVFLGVQHDAGMIKNPIPQMQLSENGLTESESVPQGKTLDDWEKRGEILLPHTEGERTL